MTPLCATTTKTERQLADFLDRKVTFSQSTSMFLREHNFDISSALGKGVPYLSREELRLVEMGFLRQPRPKDQTVNMEILDRIDLEFLEEVKSCIYDWLKTASQKVSRCFVSVGTACFYRLNVTNCLKDVCRIFDPISDGIRSTTMAIVRRVVQQEFPQCRCWRESSNKAMCITLNRSVEFEVHIHSCHKGTSCHEKCLQDQRTPLPKKDLLRFGINLVRPNELVFYP